MTQTERVIAAAGRGDICQTDFLAPDVCDGGPPITRLAARIEDAEKAGYVFNVVGRRNRCNVYRLVGGPTAPEPRPLKLRSGRGFDRAYGCRRCAALVARPHESCESYAVWVAPNVAMFACRKSIEQESRRAA